MNETITWIDVLEEQPDEFSDVLIAVEITGLGEREVFMGQFCDGRFLYTDFGKVGYPVKYWARRPEGPK